MTDATDTPAASYQFKAEIKQVLEILVHSLYKERDIFLLMYFAGGRLLPRNEKIRDISFTLVRRAYKKELSNVTYPSDPIGPYATRRTFDLPAVSIRILYWIPPLTLALLFLIILMPRSRPSDEDEE